MGILSTIFSKIFPSAHAANGPAPAASEPSPTAAGAAPSPTPMAEVDVEKMLNDMAANSAEKLNWTTSIVDLMKLLGIDSSLASRKALAQELKYTGDMNDSAALNIWLHRQVMNRVAANGGKVPASLKD